MRQNPLLRVTQVRTVELASEPRSKIQKMNAQPPGKLSAWDTQGASWSHLPEQYCEPGARVEQAWAPREVSGAGKH